MQPPIERIMQATQIVKAQGFADVAMWMQRAWARQIREERPRRQRRVHVKLLGGRAKAVLDEARIMELAETGDSE